MNILITGGLGYLGGRIANYLKTREPDSNILLTTRNKDKKLPLWADKFTVLEMNLLDEKSIINCLNNKLDVIIDLVALNEVDALKDPELALRVAKGLQTLLDKTTVDRFIYFSTFRIKENHPYAQAHRLAEEIISSFKDKMRALILRLSNGYGYPMDIDINRWTLVFNDLCKQAVTSGRIVLRSSGKQHRDFISLHDVARAVHHFLFLAPDKWGDGLYNLGGNCSMSILDLANKIADVYKRKYNKQALEIKTGPDSNNPDSSAPVRYNIDKILKSGFVLEGNMTEEIEKALSICEEFIR